MGELLYQPHWADTGRTWSKTMNKGGVLLFAIGIFATILIFLPINFKWPVIYALIIFPTHFGAFLFIFSNKKPFRIYEKGISIPSKSRYTRSSAKELNIKFNDVTEIDIDEFLVEGKERKSIRINYLINNTKESEYLDQFSSDDHYQVLTILSKQIPDKIDASASALLYKKQPSNQFDNQLNYQLLVSIVIFLLFGLSCGIALISFFFADQISFGPLIILNMFVLLLLFFSIGVSNLVLPYTFHSASIDGEGILLPQSTILGFFIQHPNRIKNQDISCIKKGLNQFTLEPETIIKLTTDERIRTSRIIYNSLSENPNFKLYDEIFINIDADRKQKSHFIYLRWSNIILCGVILLLITNVSNLI